MKRLIFISLLLFAVNIPANAWLYVASCGATCETVSRDYFPNGKEADEYYAELDELLCQGTDQPEPEQPEEPIENPK